MTITQNIGIVSKQLKRLNSTIEFSLSYIIIWNYQNTISKDLFMVVIRSFLHSTMQPSPNVSSSRT